MEDIDLRQKETNTQRPCEASFILESMPNRFFTKKVYNKALMYTYLSCILLFRYFLKAALLRSW